MTRTSRRRPASHPGAHTFPWDVVGYAVAMLVMAAWARASGVELAPMTLSLLAAALAGGIAVALLAGRRLLVGALWGLILVAMVIGQGKSAGLFFARMDAIMLGATLVSFMKESSMIFGRRPPRELPAASWSDATGIEHTDHLEPGQAESLSGAMDPAVRTMLRLRREGRTLDVCCTSAGYVVRHRTALPRGREEIHQLSTPAGGTELAATMGGHDFHLPGGSTVGRDTALAAVARFDDDAGRSEGPWVTQTRSRELVFPPWIDDLDPR